MKHRIFALILLILLLVLLSGCAAGNTAGAPKETPWSFRGEDFIGKRIGVTTNSANDKIVDNYIGDAEKLYYKSNYEIVEAIRKERIDAAIFNESDARKLSVLHPVLAILYPPIKQTYYGAVFNVNNTGLRDEFNVFLQEIKANGVCRDMEERWIDSNAPPLMPDIPNTGTNGTLTFATIGEDEPFSYIRDGKLAGFDVELAMRFAAYMGMKLDISVSSFDAVLSEVQSGKIDFACNMISINDERAKFFSFSEPYYANSMMMVVKRRDTTDQVLRNEDFTGKKIAVWTGTLFDRIFLKNVGEAQFDYYGSATGPLEAVRDGRDDALVCDEPAARRQLAQYPELEILYPPLTHDEYGFVFNKNNSGLRLEFNGFLSQIKENGVYDEIANRWLETAVPPAMPEIPLTGAGGTLFFGATFTNEPFTYITDKGAAGFEVEIMMRFAQYMGMDFKYMAMDFEDLIPATQAGKLDIAGDLCTITKGRAELIDFSDPYYTGGAVLVTRSDYGEHGRQSFWDNVKKSFYQNLIVENRWKLALNGLLVTITISLLAMLLGTMLGFLLCYMALSRLKALNLIAKTYTMLIRGMPMIVLLMIIFYIIFAEVSIDPVLVAVVAFGLNAGAFIGEIIRSAILAADVAQVEAARSIGFSRIGAFSLVTLPQAVRTALPMYKSEFVSIVKATAVVGYITIIDLTRAGDIIRSRTLDAFFPLIAVAVVYILITGAFLWLFGRIEKLADKRGRRKKA